MLGSNAEEVAPPILFPYSDLIIGRGMKSTLGVCYILSVWVSVWRVGWRQDWWSRGNHCRAATWTSPLRGGVQTIGWICIFTQCLVSTHLHNVHFREIVQKSHVFTWFWILWVTLGFSSTINGIGRIWFQRYHAEPFGHFQRSTWELRMPLCDKGKELGAYRLLPWECLVFVKTAIVFAFKCIL